MPLSCCDTLHSRENSLSRAQSLPRTSFQKVQHAVLFPCMKSSARMEGFVSSAIRTLVAATHRDLQHAEDSAFHYVSRLTLLIGSSRPGVQHAELFTSRNELVQDRSAGDNV